MALIERAGAMKPGSFTWCFSSLRQTASRMISLELCVGRSLAHRVAEARLVHREEAGPQLAVGGQADAVAVGAERLGDGVDEADLPLAVGEARRRERSRAARARCGSSG